jgi:hypothetical protein
MNDLIFTSNDVVHFLCDLMLSCDSIICRDGFNRSYTISRFGHTFMAR